MSDEDEKKDQPIRGANWQELKRRLHGMRGSTFHAVASRSAIEKLNEREAEALLSLVKNSIQDAERQGQRAGARQPWKRW